MFCYIWSQLMYCWGIWVLFYIPFSLRSSICPLCLSQICLWHLVSFYELWISGEYQIGDDIEPLDPQSVASVVQYGVYKSGRNNLAAGSSFIYSQQYPNEDLNNYTSGIIHRVLVTGKYTLILLIGTRTRHFFMLFKCLNCIARYLCTLWLRLDVVSKLTLLFAWNIHIHFISGHEYEDIYLYPTLKPESK